MQLMCISYTIQQCEIQTFDDDVLNSSIQVLNMH